MTTYEEYLDSPTWAALRRKARRLAGYRCQDCGAEGCRRGDSWDDRPELHVHHLRYPEVWGTETIRDLVVLCEDCHGIRHGKPVCLACGKHLAGNDGLCRLCAAIAIGVRMTPTELAQHMRRIRVEQEIHRLADRLSVKGPRMTILTRELADNVESGGLELA